MNKILSHYIDRLEVLFEAIEERISTRVREKSIGNQDEWRAKFDSAITLGELIRLLAEFENINNDTTTATTN
jgi:hypothetical protein